MTSNEQDINLSPRNEKFGSLHEEQQTIKKLLQEGQEAKVALLLPSLLQRFPEDASFKKLHQMLQQKKHTQTIARHLPGETYHAWLQWLHEIIQPKTYLEIGVESGASLRFAREGTLAIGIDPQPKIVHSQETWVKLFALESDDFFFKHDLNRQFNQQAVDMAFIDGLHTFDQALKDFINIEKYSHRQTVVIFHDVYPILAETASRKRQTIFWVGDTWKVIPILKIQRPDLNIITVPTYPSGLAVVTGLDPESTALKDDYTKLVANWLPVDVQDHLKDITSTQNVVAADREVVRQHLNRRC